MTRITRSLIAEATKVLTGQTLTEGAPLASKTNPSLLKEDLKSDLEKYGAATGGWIKITPDDFANYNIKGRGKDAIAGAEEIYVYDDEEGGHYIPQVVVAKSKDRYYVLTSKTNYSTSDKSSAIKKAAQEATLERI